MYLDVLGCALRVFRLYSPLPLAACRGRVSTPLPATTCMRLTAVSSICGQFRHLSAPVNIQGEGPWLHACLLRARSLVAQMAVCMRLIEAPLSIDLPSLS